MSKKLIVLPVLVLLAVSVAVATLNGNNTPVIRAKDGITFENTVCYYVQRAGQTNRELIECNTNTMTDIGLNTIKNLMGANSSAIPAVFIALGNDTAPGSTSEYLHQELNTSGMDRAEATYASAAGNGNWTIAFTWTATGHAFINTSAVFNHTSETDGIFAGDTLSSDVTLQNADQLTVTWNFKASSA